MSDSLLKLAIYKNNIFAAMDEIKQRPISMATLVEYCHMVASIYQILNIGFYCIVYEQSVHIGQTKYFLTHNGCVARIDLPGVKAYIVDHINDDIANNIEKIIIKRMIRNMDKFYFTTFGKPLAVQNYKTYLSMLGGMTWDDMITIYKYEFDWSDFETNLAKLLVC